jgi:hypothetical protein
MTADTICAVIRWQNQLGEAEPVEITFHKYEPLLPGAVLPAGMKTHLMSTMTAASA